MQNEAQHGLDRNTAKISALPSNNLDKHEYLTGEDLGLKPSTIEQTKFEYFPLGKIFNKALDEDDQREGLFTRLKNSENAQKKLIRGDDNKSIYYTPRSEFDSKDDKDKDKKSIDNNTDTKLPNVFDYLKGLSQDANKLMDEIKEADNNIDKRKLIFTGSNREKFNFNIFRRPVDFLSAIYNGEISLKEAQI